MSFVSRIVNDFNDATLFCLFTNAKLNNPLSTEVRGWFIITIYANQFPDRRLSRV